MCYMLFADEDLAHSLVYLFFSPCRVSPSPRALLALPHLLSPLMCYVLLAPTRIWRILLFICFSLLAGYRPLLGLCLHFRFAGAFLRVTCYWCRRDLAQFSIYLFFFFFPGHHPLLGFCLHFCLAGAFLHFTCYWR